MARQKQKTCLITGGSSGIGLATALRFADAGYRLAICGRDQDRLEAAHAQIVEAGSPHCLARMVDLAQPQEGIEFAETVIAEGGRVDVLVNNAAVAPLRAFDELDVEDFEAAINVNVRTVFHLTQTIWRQMLRQKKGVIVNVSSMAAIDPFPGFSVYGATKSWLDLMTVALAAEGKPHGIRVYSVRPGAVETPLLRGLFPDFPEEGAVSPGEVAGVIWTMCQREMRYASGSRVPVRK